MATDLLFVQYVADQLAEIPTVTYRAMFGEYALYVDGKVVMLLCDNQAFVKITEAGKNFAPDLPTGFPYPKAKATFLLDDRLDDRQWLCELVSLTAAELPLPKPKKKRTSRISSANGN